MSANSNPILIRSIVALCVLAWPLHGVAQDQRPAVNSLFAPRALGVSINPGTRTFNGRVSTSPGGGFVGLGGPGGAAFNPPRVQTAATAGTSSGGQARIGLGSQVQPIIGEISPNAVNPTSTVLNSADLATQPDSQVAADSGAMPSPSLASPPPRIRYGVGDSQSGAKSVTSATHLADLIQHNPHVKSRSPIAVSVRDGTTILTGRVATLRDKRVAEMLARLEPGVGRVQNELTVESAASSPSLSAPGR